ncbi:replication factor A protein 2, partial [Nowakowskiella sp. JEL0078]
MGHEMALVEQFEDVIKEFERNFTEQCGTIGEYAQQSFSNMRELENEFHERFMECVMAAYERFHKGDIEEVDDDLRDIMSDKDTLINEINAGYGGYGGYGGNNNNNNNNPSGSFGGTGSFSYLNNQGGGGFFGGSPGTNNPFSPGAADSPGAGKKKDNKVNSIRACTIKQLLDASGTSPDGPHQIDGVNIVVIVGRILTVQARSTSTVYTIEDGTGLIEASGYTGGENDSTLPHVESGDYVKLVGSFRSFMGKIGLQNIHHMHKISSLTEITSHFLEVIHTHLLITKGAPSPQQPQNLNNPNPGNGGYQEQNTGISNNLAIDNEYGDLNIQQVAVLKYFKRYSAGSPQGIYINDITRTLMSQGVGSQQEI